MRLLHLLPALAFILPCVSCEKLGKELRDEFSAQGRYKKSPPTQKKKEDLDATAFRRTEKSKKCCWCVTRFTFENRVATYTKPSDCEEKADNKDFLECRAAFVDSEQCSFVQNSYDATGTTALGSKTENLRLISPDDYNGPPEYIYHAAQVDVKCHREVSSKVGYVGSQDPRCRIEKCTCNKDENLTWNCELTATRVDRMKETLGSRPSSNRELPCSPSMCRELFPKEVSAMCPLLE